MVQEVKNSQVIYVKKPHGPIIPGEHIKVVDSTFDLDIELGEGQFVVKTLYLSVDPYQEYLILHGIAYQPGKVMFGNTLSVVLRSRNPDFKQDEIIYNIAGQGRYEEYSLVKPEMASTYRVRKEARTSGLPLSNYVGALGVCGLAAYAG